MSDQEKPFRITIEQYNKMSEQEKQHWTDRWNRLKPSPKRDMIIKMWKETKEND